MEAVPGEPVEVVVLQPNVDPYTDKFSRSQEALIDDALALADEAVGPETDLLLGPETLMPAGFWEGEASQEEVLQPWRTWQQKHPKTRILVGATTFQYYPDGEDRPSATARRFNQQPGWYDVYNSAIFLAEGSPAGIYHKSKLVVGVEEVPFAPVLEPLMGSIDLGGATGSLGKQERRDVFDAGQPGWAPLICYESIYGEYATEYVRNAAGVLCIMTNDGWWGNTPGHRQHMAFARILAIETGRPVVRSANTGISAIIAPDGTMEQSLGWDVQGTLKATVVPTHHITPFVAHGDALGRLSQFLTAFLLLAALVKARIPALVRNRKPKP